MSSGYAAKSAAIGRLYILRTRIPSADRCLGILVLLMLPIFWGVPSFSQSNQESAPDKTATKQNSDLSDLIIPVDSGISRVPLGVNWRLRSSPAIPLSISGPSEIESVPSSPEGLISQVPSSKPRFQLRSALRQEFEYLIVEHGFRIAQDPSLRYQLAHQPFFHNWIASFQGYDLKRWSDGDDFLVNGIAHPMQGAIASWIFLQNSPVGSTVEFGKDPQYWTSRLKGMAWAAAFEVQWKIGPLSETSIGNAGGWEYVPRCGTSLACVNPHNPPPTNNTGLSDWIITPIVGTGWVIAEDVIDKYVATKVGEHNRVAGIVLRSALEPTRNFAALFHGVLPWNPQYAERQFIRRAPLPTDSTDNENSWRTDRASAGLSFVSVSLPGDHTTCLHCRQNHVGVGIPYSFRVLEHLYFDSEVSHLTGSEGGDPSLQGLFGAKFGEQAQHWGLFGKIRPGFIYYKNAWSGGANPHFTNLSRFALDAGGTLEFYPNHRSAIRIDFGTTLVRYLQDYPNPRISEIESLISTDYYVTQGNFQISTGYRIRF